MARRKRSQKSRENGGSQGFGLTPEMGLEPSGDLDPPDGEAAHGCRQSRSKIAADQCEQQRRRHAERGRNDLRLLDFRFG